MQLDALKFVQGFGFQAACAAVRINDYGHIFDHEHIAALPVNPGNSFLHYAGLAAVVASCSSMHIVWDFNIKLNNRECESTGLG